MKRAYSVLLGGVILSAAAFAACSKSTPEPTPEPKVETNPDTKPAAKPSGDPPALASAAPSNKPDDIAWDSPTSWTLSPNANSMRRATYKIPRAAGDTDDAELAVSSAGGGVDANVKRWAGQFGSAEPKTEQRTVNGLKVTIVEIRGTFSSGGMGGPATPKDKQMLLGAIVDGGERQHFFKMTGPEKTVTAARKDFDKLVGSLRPK